MKRILIALVAVAAIALTGSTTAHALTPGCAYTGGGWACYGTHPPGTTPPIITDPPAEAPTSTGGRIAGGDRYETAVAISEYTYPDGADVVYLASGETLVDAITAGPLTGGPILLTTRDHLPEVTRAEIHRLGGEVIALGGTGVISDQVLLAAITASTQ